MADVYTRFISLRKLALYKEVRTETDQGHMVSTPHDKHRPVDAMIELTKRRPFVFLMDRTSAPNGTCTGPGWSRK